MSVFKLQNMKLYSYFSQQIKDGSIDKKRNLKKTPKCDFYHEVSLKTGISLC